jgi:hypothetical protein
VTRSRNWPAAKRRVLVAHDPIPEAVLIGARIVRYGRYVVFQLAKVAVTPSAVRGHPSADRPAKAAPDMSDASKVSSNPTGEVRPRSHQCPRKPGAEAFTPFGELCAPHPRLLRADAGCLMPPRRAFLAMERAHLGNVG